MEDDSSYLVTILDCNPLYWYDCTMKYNTVMKSGQSNLIKNSNVIDFDKYINSFLVYFNAFLTLHRGNKLAVICITNTLSKLVYISKSKDDDTQDSEFSFSSMNKQIKQEILNIIKETSLNHILKNAKNSNNMETDINIKCGSGSLLAGGLSHALCILNSKIKTEYQNIKPRILICKCSNDVSSQYISIMNCIFSAQKINIVIDAIVLNSSDVMKSMNNNNDSKNNNEYSSSFCEQACYLTDGIYSKLKQKRGLLQHLLMVYLSSIETRKHLTKPKNIKIDLKTTCFCCQKKIDMGYVCPICLSIYCKMMANCRTCGTRFPRKLK